jgi:hypothetical protein
MKLGYIRMPDANRASVGLDQLALADRLKFQFAYFPNVDPQPFGTLLRKPTKTIQIALDASAFGALPPTQIENAVRSLNHNLGGKLCLSVEMCGADASPHAKSAAQAFVTLFSYDPRPERAHSISRFPMKPPCPDIIGVPITGSCQEVSRAAARGYFPMSPSWLREADVARLWPAIVEGATSAVRRASLRHWQLARMVVVHDDPGMRDAYIYGPNSPIRHYFTKLARRGLIGGNIDAHINNVVIAGSSNKVAQDILSLREIVGEFGTLHMIDPAGSDPNMSRNTMVRLAEDVLPIVNKVDAPALKNLEKT